MKKAVRILGIVAALAILSAALFVPRHRSDLFIHTLASNKFCLEGELVYWSPERYWSDHIVETRSGPDYSIEYSNSQKRYYMIDGQYYGESGEGGRISFSEPKARLHQIEDMFTRVSVLSNYDFSKLKFRFSSTEEIIELATGKPVLCTFEEYGVAGTEHSIRFYFLNHNLYAIDTKENWLFNGSRWLFYVSNVSRRPEAIT